MKHDKDSERRREGERKKSERGCTTRCREIRDESREKGEKRKTSE
jgi:hypothetical protein